MEINSITLLGNSSIGIFGFSTDSYALFPRLKNKSQSELISQTLNVPVIHTTLNNSNLIGLFATGNSKTLLLPNLIAPEEFDQIRNELSETIEVSFLDTTLTAIGNVVISSDKSALISPEFSKDEREAISDALDVEIESRQLLNSNIVGSMVFKTERGMLAHPLISDNELDWLESFFRMRVDVVTVNRGTPFPRPGLIGNTHGVLVGTDTTGPELMRIYEVLSSS